MPKNNQSSTTTAATKSRPARSRAPKTASASKTTVNRRKATKTITAGPTEEQIRARAYELYLARKGQGGDPEADWLQAERDLRSEMSRT